MVDQENRWSGSLMVVLLVVPSSDEEVVRRWFDELLSAFRRPSRICLRDSDNKTDYLVRMPKECPMQQVQVASRTYDER